jgi:glycosyltransferase involved in cell wall biosynthesis
MSQDRPLVSVVLPTHDRPHRVGGALASIIAQTYRRLEVIVVDDGSTVPVEDVIADTVNGDSRITIVRHPKTVGAAAARNSGIDAASGPLIAFLDDDDRWEPEKIERQVTYLDDHPEVGMVSCQHLIEREGHPGPSILFRGPKEFSASQLLWANFFGSVSLVMVRRHLVADELRFDPSFRSVEDWDLWLRCLRVAPAAVIPEPLVRYVVHQEDRLTDTDTNRQGLEVFSAKHGGEMTDACRAFHLAHRRMGTGKGWVKRAHVLAALLAPSAATAVLLREQLARQRARVQKDPGLTERTLIRVIPSE